MRANHRRDGRARRPRRLTKGLAPAALNTATPYKSLISLFRRHTHTHTELTINPCRQCVKTLLLPESAFKERLSQSSGVWGATPRVWKSRPRDFKKCATLVDARVYIRTYAHTANALCGTAHSSAHAVVQSQMRHHLGSQTEVLSILPSLFFLFLFFLQVAEEPECARVIHFTSDGFPSPACLLLSPPDHWQKALQPRLTVD